MNKIIYDTPYGTEETYSPILEMKIKTLDTQLSCLKKQYADHPTIQELVKRMLPAVDPMLESQWLDVYGMEIITTQTSVFGFDCRVEYKDLFGIEEMIDPLEIWAIGLVLIEKIKESLPILDSMVIQPRYLENVMDAAVGSYCMSVCLFPKPQDESIKKECPD